MALDPLAQVLSNLHGKGVIVELVNLFQILGVQLLKHAPLSHVRTRGM